MALTALYYAAGLSLLLIGGGIFYACYQLALTIKNVRQIMLPQLELTLTEVQRSLGHIDSLTQEVDTTVSEANQLVSSANHAVKTVGEGVGGLRRKLSIGAASAGVGLKAAWQAFRHRPSPSALASSGAAPAAERSDAPAEAAGEPVVRLEAEPAPRREAAPVATSP